MAKMQRLQAEVAALPEGELRRFHAWFENFCAERWDQETENDYAEGKLESMAAEALAEYKAGKCKQLQDITPPPDSGSAITLSHLPFSS